jgi:tetratricopeptide (TPR) repeat protein
MVPARQPWIAGVAASALLLGACGTVEDTVYVSPDKMEQWLADKPPQTQHLYQSVLTGGQRNRVLNQMRAGLAAFEAGADDIAAQSFDDALNHIEAFYADNPRAERARSTFVPERSKAFKGESYERAMAFYYRGLLFLAEGDYGNARAVFQGGQLQDAFAEDQRYQSDFAILDVLSGWASQCEGNTVLAREFYQRAVEARPGIYIPRPSDRMLAIADIGLPPLKIGDGEYGEYLTYLPPEYVPEKKAVFIVDGVGHDATFGEDIYWQASTRGGRQVDSVLAGKAQFKDIATGVGAASLLVADVAFDVALYSYDDDDSDAALGVAAGAAVIGIASLLMADAARPEADTRYWDNLPAHIDYVSLPHGAIPTEVAFLDGRGSVLGSLTPRVRIDPKGACGLAYARSRHATEIPSTPPNSSLAR